MALNFLNNGYFGGKLGIGTESPQAKLHVLNSVVGGNYYGQLVVETNGEAAIQLKGTTFSSIYFSDAAAPYQSGVVFNHSTNKLELRGAGNTDDLTITEAGNVGIGTDSPSYKLSVNGTIQSDLIRGYTYPTNSFLDFDDDQTAGANHTRLASIGRIAYLADTNANEPPANPAHEFFTGTSDIDTATSLMIIETSGNVGIGTTSPSARLNVKASGSTVDQIAVTHSGNTVEIAQLGQSANGNSAGALLLKTNGGTDTIYLDAAGTSYINGGNVGIGTTSPSTTLQLTKANTEVLANNPAWPAGILEITDTSTYNAGTGATIVFRKKRDSTGNQVTVGAIAGEGVAGASRLSFWTGDSAYMGTAPKMVINNAGNVGIGTTSPQTTTGVKLDVIGGVGAWAANNTSTLNLFYGRLLGPGRKIANLVSYNGNGALDLYDAGNTLKIHIQGSGNSYFNGGNVGIGTTSPDANLEVESASGGVLRLTSSDTTVLTGESIGKIEFKSNDASTSGNNVMGFIDSVATNVGTRYALSFGTGDAAAAVERMRITNLGGISFGSTGTAYGTSGQILKSNGNASPTWIDGSAIPGVPAGSGTLNTVAMWTPDGDTLGNSIITQPTSAEVRVAGTLKVNSTVAGYSSTKIQTGGFGDSQSGINILNSTTGYGYILFGDGSGANLYRGQITYKHGDDFMAFNTAGSERMRIDSSGNVMIGNTGAGAKLDVRADTGYVFRTENASGNTFRIEASSGNIYTTGDLYIEDNNKIRLGASSDLQIYHDGTNSFINNLTGDLTIENAGDDLILKSADDFIVYVKSQEIAIQADSDGKVGLRYNNVEKFATTSTGVSVTGNVLASGYLAGQSSQYNPTGGGTTLATLTNNSASRTNLVISNQTNNAAASAALVLATYGHDYFIKGSSSLGGSQLTLGFNTSNFLTLTSSAATFAGNVTATNRITVAGSATGNPYLDFTQAGTEKAYLQYVDSGDNLAIQSDGIITFRTAASAEKIRIDSAGNVGIGLTNPADRLDLYDSNDNVGMYFHTATSGTGGGNGLRVGQNNANAFVWNYEATPISLATGGTARLTINATGGIRFNTGYGAGTLVTDASGNITVSSGGGAGGPYLPLTAGSSYPLTDTLYGTRATFGDTTIDVATVTIEGGQTGILDIWRNGTNANYQAIRFRDNTNSNTEGSIGWGPNNLRLNGTDYIVATTGGSEHMRITADGNVGIGTTNPETPLHVLTNTTDNASTMLIQNGSTGDASIKFNISGDTYSIGIDNSDSDKFKLSYGAVGTNDRIVVDTSGNVGIGTTAPGEKLEVVGNIRTNVGNGLGFMLTGSSASGLVRNAGTGLALRTNSIDKLIIDSTGSVTFSAYTGTNEQGTPTYLLGTDASGNVVKTNTVPGSGAGPYLPLTAGSSYPLTGELVINSSGVKVEGAATDQYFFQGFRTGNSGPTFSVYDNSSVAFVNSYQAMFFRANQNGGSGGHFAFFGGNVGIGTTSPTQAKLVVNTTSLVASAFGRDGTDGDVVQIYNGLAGTTKVIALGASGNDGTIYSQYGDLLLQPTAGNVGIGTTSPGAKLEINNGSTQTELRISVTGDTGYSTINFSDASDINPGQIYYHHQQNLMNFRTNDNDRMVINSSGNVGIGTTSPSLKLEVAGNIGLKSDSAYLRFRNAAAADLGYITNSTTWGDSGNDFSIGASSSNLRFYTNNSSTERMRIDSAGDVGIGTDNPIYKLDVVSAGDGLLSLTGATKPAMIFKVGTAVVGGIQAQINTSLNVSAYGTSSLNLQTAGTAPRLTILTGGNVGIGTTSPGVKLDVSDVIRGRNSIRVDAASTGSPYLGLYQNGGEKAYLQYQDSGDKLVLQSDGYFALKTGGESDRITVLGNGNVGIGTSSPATQLEIFEINDDPATLRLSSEITDGDLVGAIISFSNDAGGGGVQGRIENVSTEDDTTVFKFYTDNTSSPSMTLFDSGNMTIAGTLTQNSDVRLKENIKPIESALDKVKQMQGVEFNKINSSTKEIGVVAQEIEKIIPELVLEDKEGIKSVAYGNITAVLIEAIKEQQKQIEELKQQLNK